MEVSVVAIVVIAGAVVYALTHALATRLSQRLLLTTGAEYLLMGALFAAVGRGAGVELMTPESLLQLNPMISLAIGWLGLMYGMQANLKELLASKDGAIWFTGVEGLLVVLTVWATAYLVLPHVGTFTAEQVQMGAIVLAASAAVGSTSVVELVQKRFGAAGRHTDLLMRSSRLGELLSIMVFGLLFCIYHAPVGDEMLLWLARDVTTIEWFVLSIASGVVLGGLCLAFLGDETDADRLFLGLLGTIVFACGVAYFLNLSTLLVNLVLGAVLINSLPEPERLMATLQRAHRPMVVILLLFAGAVLATPMHSLDPGLTTGVVLLYLVMRGLAKVAGGHLGSRPDTRRDLGRGMLGQGEIAVAMAVSFRLVFPDAAVTDLVVTVILVSVMINDFLAPSQLKRVLIDAGEISGAKELAA